MLSLKKYLYLQTFALLGGTTFAYYNVYLDFQRFFQYESSILQFTDCTYPNPLATSCFYGALCFLIAFFISTNILLKVDENFEKAKKQQHFLVNLLIFGVIFGFANVGFEYYKFLNAPEGEYFGCTGVKTSSPLQTPCFYGSLFFFANMVISIFTKKAFNKLPTV